MDKKHLTRIFQVITGILLGLAAVFVFIRSRGPESPPEGYFLSEPLEAPEISLTSHRGEPFSSALGSERILVVFFGYTSCPDVCPLTLSHLSRVFAQLEEAAERIQVLFVTVDPDRDTPERMGRYLGSFHPSFLGLTGTEEEIRSLADAFGVFFLRNSEGEDYTVDHTARTFVVDANGRIPLTFPITATPEEMTRDLAQLLGGLQ